MSAFSTATTTILYYAEATTAVSSWQNVIALPVDSISIGQIVLAPLTEDQLEFLAKLAQLERRSGFRSYVAATEKVRARSAAPANADASRKVGRWLGIARTIRRRVRMDQPEDRHTAS
jgi:hypothetical protein